MSCAFRPVVIDAFCEGADASAGDRGVGGQICGGYPRAGSGADRVAGRQSEGMDGQRSGCFLVKTNQQLAPAAPGRQIGPKSATPMGRSSGRATPSLRSVPIGAVLS